MSEHQVSIAIEDCVITISGSIDRHTVSELTKQIDLNKLCKDQFSIDFSAVVRVDTAGLAWILKIMAEGKQSGQTVNLKAVPEALMSLAGISGVDKLLQSV